ncbi:polysaccharide lyase family 8 super-sandwich domain-containing protein [Bacteroides sp.]
MGKKGLLLMSWLLTVVCNFTLASDLDSIRNAVRQELLNQEKEEFDVAKLMRTQSHDGSWKDINYVDTSNIGWQHDLHMERLCAMALAYSKPSSVFLKKRELLEHIQLGLRFWLKHDFICANWWFNKIKVPAQMLTIGYLLDEDLDGELRKGVTRIIDRIDVDDYPARPGGDRIQVASNHAKAVLFERDEEEVARLFRIIENEAQIAPMEEVMYDAAGGLGVRNRHRPAGRGLQPDLSFHHRGDRVNSTLTYGMELPEYYTYWAAILQNTRYHFTTEHTRLVVDYYLDGVCRHLVCWNRKEPGAVNREISRENEMVVSTKLVQALLKICEGYRENELQHVYEASMAGAPMESSVKFFWCSEYFTFHRPHFATGVRMHSVRNMNMEYPHNGEGIKNHFRGDGACYLTVDGTEYQQTQPVYDFRKIPGTTTPLWKEFPGENAIQREGLSRFVGGIDDKEYGAAAFDFLSTHTDLRAKKSWFFFDEGYVCLGTGIFSSTSDTIVTTLEQCALNGAVTMEVDGTKRVLAEGGYRVNAPRWVLHKGVGYVFLDSCDIHLSARAERGSWTNCMRTNRPGFDKEVVKKMFSLTINHGKAPQNGSYAYAVLPASTVESLSVGKMFFKILKNTPEMQAVEHADRSLAYVVFYKPGRIDLGDRGVLEVDNACMVMLREGKVYVSDPTRQLHVIHISLSGRAIEVPLPTWQRAGITSVVSY